MEKTLDITHLLNEECDNTFDGAINLFEMDPELDYMFNVDDSGLSLTVIQG
ncbi:hypothetical protein [Acinetobacter phage AB1I1M-1]